MPRLDITPNTLFQDARQRVQSPQRPGKCLSQSELATEVNTYLHDHDILHLDIDTGYISKIEAGRIRWPREQWRRRAFQAVLRVDTHAQIGLYPTRRSRKDTGATAVTGPANVIEADQLRGAGLSAATADGHGTSRVTVRGAGVNQDVITGDVRRTQDADPVVLSADTRNRPDLHEVELLRQGLNDALSEGTMAEASLDDWESTVVRYGRATRDRPPGILLDDLGADLVELKRALHRHRSASALCRLTRVAAQMSGLMCLTFCKLDDRPAFRRWARTARLAADEAGDPQTSSWVLAQEAYGHYYSADLVEALDVAQHAQAIVAAAPCVGAALAAALEARAYAAMGHDRETRAALGRAEEVLSHLDGDALIPSAFSYNEAQLRFHEGSAFTHLGNARSAFTAQDRALALCAPGDYTDWAMTRLDRARCLTTAGESADAVYYATETLTMLSRPQRRGIITLRGLAVLNALPKPQQATPAARDLRDLLMLTTEEKEVLGP